MKKLLLLILVLFVGATCLQAEDAQKAKLDLYKAKVIAAAKLLEKDGLAKTEAIFLDKKGPYFFDGEEGYLFIIDSKGDTHLNAAKPALKGKNLLLVKDVKGFAFFDGMIKMAKKYNSGWVAYQWPKPGEVAASPKVSYVELVKKDGIEYIVGSGLYDISMENINTIYPAEKSKKIQ